MKLSLTILILSLLGSLFGSVASQPDLKIAEIYTVPTEFRPNENVTIKFRVVNIGNNFSGDFYTAIYFDGKKVKEIYCDGLQPYQLIKMNYSLIWPDDVFTHEIKCFADIYNNVSESNEGNNIKIEFFNATNMPPLVPTIIGPKEGEIGKEYEFRISSIDPENDPIFYFIKWGDGNVTKTEYKKSGEEIIVKHAWYKGGRYKILVKAIDKYKASSKWAEKEIIIKDNIPPKVIIAKPRDGIYVFDRKIFPYFATIVFGKITIEAIAINGVEKVEFYIDNLLRHTSFECPYKWIWDETVFGIHKICVKAYDIAGNFAIDEETVWIANL